MNQSVVIILSSLALDLGIKIKNAVPQSELHAMNLNHPDVDCSYDNFSSHIATLFKNKYTIIAVCSAGVVIRSLAESLKNKTEESPVIVVSNDGRYIIPILGAHSGGNKISHNISYRINAEAVITNMSDLRLGIALDDPPDGYVLGDYKYIKSIASRILNGEDIQSLPNISWFNNSQLKVNKQAKLSIDITIEDKISDKDKIIYHPQKLVLGVGTIKGASFDSLLKLVETTLKNNNLSKYSIALLATIDLKENEDAINQLAKFYNLPIVYYTKDDLNKVLSKIEKPSQEVFDAVGCYSVSEASSILAAGDNSNLIVNKQKYNGTTCAIAISKNIILNSNNKLAKGKLSIIGLGPGASSWRSIEANHLLEQATDIVGFDGYIKLLDYDKNKKYHSFEIGQEEERAMKSIELASSDKNVALVCSGDPGIYAMASIVFEMIEFGPDIWKNIEIITSPGISAVQAAAARVGAPIGNDFCTISLSDLMTTQQVILDRVKAAAKADFIIALYNPSSKLRKTLIKKVVNIIRDYRKKETPIVIARSVGRKDEKIEFTTINDIETDTIDMMTLLIIGSTKTRSYFNSLNEQKVYTPRGYNVLKGEKNR
ncbi:MAG: precorrin-3B C(17)-methyltransferase [Alphaproteobacteria bacterium]|jgi:cobalt-precorrin 5A hydrolase/precorrin-3B C17-methyltransferase